MDKKLHWTQRVALVQHSLHMAGLSRDFTFFKHLQAQGLIEGTDHAAVLDHLLNEDDDAVDVITLNMDKFNAVIACVYEDAFKNAYGSAKACKRDQQAGRTEGKALFQADLVHQKKMADESIDKMLSLAVDMIKKQPVRSQDAAADVLIRGATFTADAMEVCLKHMDALENHMDDSGHLEESWTIVQSAVGLAVSAMKGVFSLMASTPKENAKESESEEQQKHVRSQSVDGYARLMLRRMSTALAGAPPPTPTESPRSGSTSSWASALSRRSSISSLFSNPSNVFADSNGTKKASNYGQKGPTLSPIPATPLGTAETLRDPFEKAFAANESAFANNTVADDEMDPADPAPPHHLRSRRSSENVAPGDTSAPKPEPENTTTTAITAETHQQDTQARMTSPPTTRSPAPPSTSASPPTSHHSSPRSWSGPLSARSLLSRASIPAPINTNIESNTKATATRYGGPNTSTTAAAAATANAAKSTTTTTTTTIPRSSAADRYSPSKSGPSERSTSIPSRRIHDYNGSATATPPNTSTSIAHHTHASASTSTSTNTSKGPTPDPSRSDSNRHNGGGGGSGGASASALPLPANALRAHPPTTLPPTLPPPANLSMGGMRRRSANIASGSHRPQSLERLFDEIV